MKAISLWQPFASLLVWDLKPDETRGWPIPWKIVHHAVKIQAAMIKPSVQVKRGWLSPETAAEALDVLIRRGVLKAGQSLDDLPRGGLVGQVVFGAPRPTDGLTADMRSLKRFGNYARGRYYWPCVNAIAFAAPVPWKGRQGWFEVPDDLGEVA